ncbi:hypothetical protein RIF29_34003 [Crotalaria pallida]|uniref:Uncharacterized protein n=1 Tax=Crotalaria pallida TaxID=3830 RepID=A0AAN9E8X9_CROPI
MNRIGGIPITRGIKTRFIIRHCATKEEDEYSLIPDSIAYGEVPKPQAEDIILDTEDPNSYLIPMLAEELEVQSLEEENGTSDAGVQSNVAAAELESRPKRMKTLLFLRGLARQSSMVQVVRQLQRPRRGR